MNRSEVLTYARMAGQVLRYHTWPVHHRQTVGEHTWQLLRIYETIWGAIPAHMTSYILWHDAGELVTGDIPYPAKHLSLALRAGAEELEQKALANMRSKHGINVLLTPIEKQKAKMCDLIDMYEFGLTELAMGNKFAQPIVEDIGKAMDELGTLMPGCDTEAVAEYVSKVRNRFKCTS